MTLPMKFSQKILLAASAVIILVFVVFAGYNDYRQRNEIRYEVEHSLRNIGEVLALNIQSWLSGRLLLTQGMAQAIAVDDSRERVLALLKSPALTDTFVASYVGRESGEFAIYPPRTMPDGYDARQRSWYQDALKSGPALTTPYIGAGTDYLVITQAAPIRAGDRTLGVLGVNLNLDRMAQMINAQNFDGVGYAFLVSADGKILVHPDKQWVGKSLAELFSAGSPSLDGGFSEVTENGSFRLVGFVPVQGLPSVKWYVGLSLDKSKAYAALTDFRVSAVVATLVAVLITLLLLGMWIRLLMRPLRAMDCAMQDIADGEGDLTRRLAVRSNDEFGRLAGAFNRFVERIHTSICEVATTTSSLGEVARQVLEASNSSLTKSDGQAARTNSVATAIEELGAAAQEIAHNAADASSRASDARVQSDKARLVVARTIAAMNDLSASIEGSRGHIEALNGKTANIGQILDVIKGISEQTNLLALNAAIEAARAGEAGRGFAVVADEVRNLAHRTQTSAQEIHRMIEELQVGSRTAVDTMAESRQRSIESVQIANQAGERLLAVTGRIGEIDGMNQSVAAATEEQTSVVDMVNREVTEITMLNQEGVENLQATLRACADLEAQAQRLRELVGSFRI
ncbi:methyl-accepting chemotaxis protein [Pseudomonas asiatica]|uniref:Methyl-accepting chemotaxis protein n=1 Tax=Pseudomonas asiatica TaxID=2219225 RepID=A0A9X4DHS3_9PSED|nr:methyl-accepting chemotaxis protein [Pseudomonas asiatica]MEE1902649.1 methyl-accepting chemotaxis protein [Pseudomonas inefficax]MDD2114778.1 methyl-accepting chemotaxis protein [Pseudomonas asiatica]MEE1907442.1 methyl-accepting chemotaxis protein [Pseudomonas inefficax]MEE1984906.1 methyl-accepting chemotaxis protein [Pseudomonas inefficax]WJN48866.1 methyl-accepting chemotaxis protein [Pseudomonas asiatica]